MTQVIAPDYLQLAGDRLTNCLKSKHLTAAETQTIVTLQAKLKQSIIEIAAFGLVSRGKTAVLNALLGKKIGDTGALNGTTKDVISAAWYGEEQDGKTLNQSLTSVETAGKKSKAQLKLTDTPGLDEIAGEARAEIAKQVAKQADLILFVIAGDLSRQEQEALIELRLAYKPILLVFNKIDLYPDCDRHSIYTALQNPSLQALISPQEIVLTAAEPLPTKVRIQYADSSETTEVWENLAPNVSDLKTKILDLLNQEGKALLAINAMQTLAEIQDKLIDRHLQRLPPVRNTAAVIFVLKAIALGISPTFWSDLAISVAVDGLWLAWWVRGYPLMQMLRWWGIIAVNAITGSGLGWETNLTQIAWLGASTTTMLHWLQADLRYSSSWGMSGARNLIQQILQQVPDSSLLKRIAQLHQSDFSK